MREKARRFFVSSGLACALAWTGFAQTPNAAPPPPQDNRAAAYYNFAMGHMYSELAAQYGYREYVDKAIEHYRAALKADPAAGQASEELTDLYIQAGKLADAVSEAEDMLKRNPQNLEARRMLGRIYSRLIQDPQNRINEDRLKQAIEQFRKITEQDKKDLDSWVWLGRLYKIAQNSVDSEKAYKEALAIDPSNEYALSGLALVYSDLGDNKNAVEMWKRLVEQNPNARTLRALAGAYEQVHDYKAAARTLQKALELAPRDVEMKKNLAEDLLLSNDVESALKLYSELAQAEPKDPRLQLRLSQIYRQKRDFAKAREAHERARALDSDSLEIRYNDVQLLDAEGKYPEAITALKTILDSTAKRTYTSSEQSNRAILMERLGQLYRQSGQYPLAAETFQKIAQLDPESAARASAQVIDTWRQAGEFAKAEQEAADAVRKYPANRTVKLVRATLLSELGRTEEAAAAAKQLLNGKDDRETYLTLAQIYDKGKKYPEMAHALDSAEKLSESNDDKEGVFFMRGAMYEKMQKLELAETEFRKALEINPDNAAALNYLGYMFADRNMRLAEARKLIMRALELEPGNGAFLDSLGWVNYRLGKLDDAETYLRQAIERVGKDPTIHDHLGDVYFQQGKLKDAISQWEMSIKEWQGSSTADADPAEMAKVQKKLESARVRLARETGAVKR